MKLTVYGTGCAKCKMLYEAVGEVIKTSGVQVQLEKEEDIEAIMNAGIMRTPALALDGKILVSGRVPSSAEIQGWLKP